MEWINSVEFNSTLPVLVWDNLVDKFQEQSQVWGKVFFERVVLPVGQSLLYHTELAVQYTLNGDYEAVQEVTRTSLAQTLSWLDLTTFQVKLLREFSVIFLGNSLLVLLAWRVYGQRIRNKFMSSGRQGSSRKNIEALRTSLSELKLPQEMDFKFK